MATFYYGSQHQQSHLTNPHPAAHPHSNHHGRSRRAPRLSTSHNAHRQFRGSKTTKEMIVHEAPSVTAFRARFEAGRSFDLDDDLEFCPYLLSFDERQSVTSGSSDRSSLSSGSPSSSPLQHQIQPQQITPALTISAAVPSAYVSPPAFNVNNNLKIHQPSAIRSRNAIPIVNPATGNRIASPPSSISPGMMQQSATRRW